MVSPLLSCAFFSVFALAGIEQAHWGARDPGAHPPSDGTQLVHFGSLWLSGVVTGSLLVLPRQQIQRRSSVGGCLCGTDPPEHCAYALPSPACLPRVSARVSACVSARAGGPRGARAQRGAVGGGHVRHRVAEVPQQREPRRLTERCATLIKQQRFAAAASFLEVRRGRGDCKPRTVGLVDRRRTTTRRPLLARARGVDSPSFENFRKSWTRDKHNPPLLSRLSSPPRRRTNAQKNKSPRWLARSLSPQIAAKGRRIASSCEGEFAHKP